MTEDKSVDFNFFLEQLISATAKIESRYFNFPVAGAENSIYRERVYCYELYHQLRCILGNAIPYTLHGEVDKRGNLDIPPELQGTKPDFIIHVPGTKKNLVVIEVKQTNNDNNKIKEDIDKFKKFLNYGYYRAIMLIYGDNESKVKYARSEIDSLSEYSECILLLWHKEYFKPAEEYKNVRPA